jgi:uncharacterized membrane protein YgdD (TMEM256/DUF423 family)
MKLAKNHQQNLAIGFILFGLCILIGAFGAHGLENKLTFKAMKTFHTGVTYHRLASFAWICLALIQIKFEEINFSKCFLLFFLGIILFSGNCYIYALTQNKIYAQIMPLGGIFLAYAMFLVAWKLFLFRNTKPNS